MINTSYAKLLIVGNPLPFHVGGYFINAAKKLEIDFRVSDIREAAGPSLLQKIYWRLWDKSYFYQSRFESSVLKTIESFNPTLGLTIGICPLRAAAINKMKQNGVRCVNFLTDDPFNKHHRCEWFLKSLPHFDIVYSPRRSNMSDLGAIGCKDVRYLPFAYDPDVHYPAPECDNKPYDVLFVGGADEDRVPYMRALGEAGLKVLVLGGYWNKYHLPNVEVGGHATIEEIREATAKSKTALILVRKNNRDGHVMRTFEAAAMGTCLVVERTQEHEELLQNVESGSQMFFESKEDLLPTIQRVLESTETQRAIRETVLDAVQRKKNTYVDRLSEILANYRLIDSEVN